jgi:large subunit ribosomal protein L28
MAKICELTGKKPRVGNLVSHAKNKTKRWFYPNLQTKKFFLTEGGIWLTLKVSTSVLRTINKKGLDMVLREARKRGTLAKELSRFV